MQFLYAPPPVSWLAGCWVFFAGRSRPTYDSGGVDGIDITPRDNHTRKFHGTCTPCKVRKVHRSNVCVLSKESTGLWGRNSIPQQRITRVKGLFEQVWWDQNQPDDTALDENSSKNWIVRGTP